MTADQLKAVLDAHALWIKGEERDRWRTCARRT